MLKSCLRQAALTEHEGVVSVNVLAEDDASRKRVRFAEKLDNDASLDSQDRERIEHNLKYNDDTIFDNISIFRDLNDSGLVLRPRIKDRKDVHPLKLKLPAEADEDEEMQEEAIADQAEDPAIKEFWGIDPIPKQTPAANPAENSGVSPIQARKPNNSS